MVAVAALLALAYRAIVCRLEPAGAPDGPSLEFTQTEFDGGVYSDPRAATVHHGFRFQNNGAAPLEISGVKTTCGCTVGTISKKSLLPGEAGLLDVNLMLESLGNQSRQVLVFSNDPKSPSVVTIAGTYEPPVMATVVPHAIDLGTFRCGSVAKRQIRVELFNRTSIPVNIVRVASKGNALSAAVANVQHHPDRTTSGYYWTTVSIDVQASRAERGDLNEVLVLGFDNATLDAREIPVFGRAIDSWVSVPQRIVFVDSDRGIALPACRVVLEGPAQTVPRCTKIDNPMSGWLRVQPSVTPDGARCELIFSLLDHPPGDWRGDGVVTIIVDGGNGPSSVQIPVVVRSWKPASTAR